MNSIICVTTALPADGAVVGGRESLVFTIQVRIPRQPSYARSRYGLFHYFESSTDTNELRRAHSPGGSQDDTLTRVNHT